MAEKSQPAPASPVTKVKKYMTANVYFGPQHEGLLARMHALEKRFPGVSVSGLMVTATAACIETFEKEIPKKRSFKLNGCTITV